MPFARNDRPGLLGTIARTASISGTARGTADAANRPAARRGQESEVRAAAAQEEAPQARTPPAPVPPVSGKELAEQLSRLADLRSSGLLTDAEFVRAKARLLM